MAVPSHTSCPADGSLPDVAAASRVTALVAATGLYPLPGASDGIEAMSFDGVYCAGSTRRGTARRPRSLGWRT